MQLIESTTKNQGIRFLSKPHIGFQIHVPSPIVGDPIVIHQNLLYLL